MSPFWKLIEEILSASFEHVPVNTLPPYYDKYPRDPEFCAGISLGRLQVYIIECVKFVTVDIYDSSEDEVRYSYLFDSKETEQDLKTLRLVIQCTRDHQLWVPPEDAVKKELHYCQKGRD